MSDTDTTNVNPDATPAVPLDAWEPAIVGGDTEELTVNEAREELRSARRGPLTAEPLKLLDGNGDELAANKSLKESDLPRVAKMLGDARERQTEELVKQHLSAEEERAAELRRLNGEAEPEPADEAQPRNPDGTFAAEEAEPDPLAEERARVTEREAKALELQKDAEEHSRATLFELARLSATKFSGIKTEQDLALLAQVNPEMHQQFLDALKLGYGAKARLAQFEEATQARTRANSPQEEAKFFKAHPEYKDPAAGQKFMQEIQPYLVSKGIAPSDLKSVYRNPLMQTAEGLSILADAIKWRAAQESRKNLVANRAPVPPVQRPGMARVGLNGNDARIRALQNAPVLTPGQAREQLRLMRSKG